MAKLEDLVPLFHSMDEAEQLAFVRKYRNKRLLDIDQYVTGQTRKSKSTKSSINLTDEEKDLMKRLGISLKQLTVIKSIEVEESDGGSDDDEDKQLFDL